MPYEWKTFKEAVKESQLFAKGMFKKGMVAKNEY